MVNQLMGVSSESEVNQMAGFFSDFVDGCLSVPINLPGFTYHTAMKVYMISFTTCFLIFSGDSSVLSDLLHLCMCVLGKGQYN